MQKGQNGASLLPLIIGVILVIAIIVFGAYLIFNEVEKKDIENMDTNMLLIQAKARVIAEKNRVNKDENPLKGQLVEDNEFKQKVGVVEEEILYIWDKTILEEAGLTEVVLAEGAFYVVDYKEEVIYSEGYTTKEGNVLYKLSEISELLKEKNEEKE